MSHKIYFSIVYFNNKIMFSDYENSVLIGDKISIR